jgi:hypothetical protein
MAPWLDVTPVGGPKEVESARSRAAELRGRVAGERGRVEQAKNDLLAAEKMDRDRMAAAFANGAEPASDVREIERLRSALAESERRSAALDAAVATADRALGDSVERNRSRWLASVGSEIAKKRGAATRSIEQVASLLDELSQLEATGAWLESESTRPAKVSVPAALSSRGMMANGQPANQAQLLAWIAETIEAPVPPVEPPDYAQPLQSQEPVMGAVIS